MTLAQESNKYIYYVINCMAHCTHTLSQTSNTELMQPSFSGLLSTYAYLDQMTLPVCVTNPNSDTFTSIIVPFVITPRFVYKLLYGFFFTPKISSGTVVFNSGCVTFAFLNLKPVGRMYLSYFGALRVKLSPTKQTLLILRFHASFLRLPDFMT